MTRFEMSVRRWLSGAWIGIGGCMHAFGSLGLAFVWLIRWSNIAVYILVLVYNFSRYASSSMSVMKRSLLLVHSLPAVTKYISIARNSIVCLVVHLEKCPAIAS